MAGTESTEGDPAGADTGASPVEGRPVVIGEVLFDCFPDGSTVLGGAPFNVAWHLQAFGLRPLVVTRVGDDALGERVLTTMESWRMVDWPTSSTLALESSLASSLVTKGM